MMFPPTISIIVTNSKAYLPLLAKSLIGFFAVNPIRVAELTSIELTEAIEEVKNKAHPEISIEEVNKIRASKMPILQATKKRSQRQLALTGRAYAITWDDTHILVSISTCDKQNRWIFEKHNLRQFPLNTTIYTLAELIVADAKSYPEVHLKTQLRAK